MPLDEVLLWDREICDLIEDENDAGRVPTEE